MERWVAAGARVKGHKVGLTSAAMQRQMSVSIPVGPGDTVTATFAGLGRVTARFASFGAEEAG